VITAAMEYTIYCGCDMRTYSWDVGRHAWAPVKGGETDALYYNILSVHTSVYAIGHIIIIILGTRRRIIYNTYY